MSRTVEGSLRWVAEGTALVRRALEGLDNDEALEQPSALPGWTRKHVLAHLAANADAVGNLVSWAKTGVETPMYTSMAQRNADIEAGAQQSAVELLAWFDRSATALAEGFAALSDAEWQHPVVTAQGRTVPATETPWMRAREVMVHAVDLAGEVTFAGLPADFLAALGGDILTKRGTTGGRPVTARATDADVSFTLPGEGEEIVVTGPLAHLVAWLAGRDSHDLTADNSDLPDLGPWL